MFFGRRTINEQLVTLFTKNIEKLSEQCAACLLSFTYNGRMVAGTPAQGRCARFSILLMTNLLKTR